MIINKKYLRNINQNNKFFLIRIFLYPLYFDFNLIKSITKSHKNGEMAERLKAPVLKTGKVATPSRVRISVSPPLIF